eukprot:RCo044762
MSSAPEAGKIKKMNHPPPPLPNPSFPKDSKQGNSARPPTHTAVAGAKHRERRKVRKTDRKGEGDRESKDGSASPSAFFFRETSRLGSGVDLHGVARDDNPSGGVVVPTILRRREDRQHSSCLLHLKPRSLWLVRAQQQLKLECGEEIPNRPAAIAECSRTALRRVVPKPLFVEGLVGLRRIGPDQVMEELPLAGHHVHLVVVRGLDALLQQRPVRTLQEGQAVIRGGGVPTGGVIALPRDPRMGTEHPVINGGCQRQVHEDLVDGVPHVHPASIPEKLNAAFVKPVLAVDRGGLVVPAKKMHSVGVQDLQRQHVHNHLHTGRAAVDVVPKKKEGVVGLFVLVAGGLGESLSLELQPLIGLLMQQRVVGGRHRVHK